MFQFNSSSTYVCRGSDQYHEIRDALYSLNSSRGSKLENVLLEFYKDHRITENEKVKFQGTFDKISNYIKQCFRNVIVCLYGSHVNGLANKDSDLDITVLFKYGKYFSNLQRSEQIKRLRIIYSYLSQRYLNLIFISKAKIPIIKFTTINGVNVDISIDNFHALQSTHLLKTYIDLDSRLIVLGQLLKQVVKFYKTGGACDGMLSSFGYILMLIHYLQAKRVLPILRQGIDYAANPIFYECSEMYPNEKFIEASHNCQKFGIVDLWIGFFKYYTMEFDIRRDVISIAHPELGTKFPRFCSSYFSIESPLDSSVDVACHIEDPKARKIFNSFIDVLLRKGNVDQISLDSYWGSLPL